MKNRYLHIALLVILGYFFPVILFANQSYSGDQAKKTVIIRLKDQYDTTKSKSKVQGLSPELRKQIVIADMKEFCEQSQSRFIQSFTSVPLKLGRY